MPTIYLSIRPSLWQVIFALSNPWASYFRASPSFDELFSCRPFNSPPIYPFGELFLCHPSVPLASYFCATHPSGELFLYCPTLGRVISCYLFDSPSFGELFLCRPFNSRPMHPFGELFLCHPSLRRVIFVLSNPWASYFSASLSFSELFSC